MTVIHRINALGASLLPYPLHAVIGADDPQFSYLLVHGYLTAVAEHDDDLKPIHEAVHTAALDSPVTTIKPKIKGITP